jgi:hypothetical protein
LWLISGASIVLSVAGCATKQAHRPPARAALAQPTTFPATSCSDVWTGPRTGGVWTSARYWSMGVVPGATDMACVPAKVTIRVTHGRLQVGSLIDAGTLLATGGSLAIVEQGVVAEFATVTVRHGASVRFAGRIEGGTLNMAGDVSIGEPRLIIGGVARARAFVPCIPNYTPKNEVQECMRRSPRYGHPMMGSGRTSGALTDPAITPMAHKLAPLGAAASPTSGFWPTFSARPCAPPVTTGLPGPPGHDHMDVRLVWRQFATEVNAIECHPERDTVQARKQLLGAMTAQACLFFDQHPPATLATLATACRTQLRLTLLAAPLRPDIDNLEVTTGRAYGDAYGNVRFTFLDGAWRISEL